MKESKALQIVL